MAGAVVDAQGGQLAPQTTDFGNAVQPRQLAQLARGLVLQLLDGLDAAQRHVGQQDNHVQRAVVAAQLCQAIVDVSKQAILRQGRQGAQHAAKGDVAAGFKADRSTVEKTKCRQDTLIRPGARRTHFRRGIVDGPRGLVGGGRRLWSRSVFRCWLSRLEWTGLGQSSLLNRLAERVELEAQVLGDFSSAPTSSQQLLCLGRDLRRQHRGTARRTRRVERLHAPGAILVDAANDAVLRDAEGPHDVHLAAGALADQLGGEHPKRAAVALGVMKHRLSAAEVDPLTIFAHDADQIADARGTVGDERQ